MSGRATHSTAPHVPSVAKPHHVWRVGSCWEGVNLTSKGGCVCLLCVPYRLVRHALIAQEATCVSYGKGPYRRFVYCMGRECVPYRRFVYYMGREYVPYRKFVYCMGREYVPYRKGTCINGTIKGACIKQGKDRMYNNEGEGYTKAERFTSLIKMICVSEEGGGVHYIGIRVYCVEGDVCIVQEETCVEQEETYVYCSSGLCTAQETLVPPTRGCENRTGGNVFISQEGMIVSHRTGCVYSA